MNTVNTNLPMQWDNKVSDRTADPLHLIGKLNSARKRRGQTTPQCTPPIPEHLGPVTVTGGHIDIALETQLEHIGCQLGHIPGGGVITQVKTTLVVSCI